MNLVLALEPDASQATPLTTLVRRQLGANLAIVPTAQAAIIAMNQRAPDVLLFGRDVPRPERAKAAAHLASLSGGSGVRTLELAKLGDPAAREKAAFDIRMCLAAAEKERVRAMVTVIGSAHHDSELAGWNDFPPESPEPQPPVAAPSDHSSVQAEIDRRVKSEVERLRREAEERIAVEVDRLRQDTVASQAPQPKAIEARARQSAGVIQWRMAALAALVAFAIGLGVLWLPGVVSSAAQTSTTLAGTAQDAARAAAKQAISAAPEVTRSALSAAETVLPHVDVVKSPGTGSPPLPAAVADKPATITGPGFLTAFSRIPMEVYADGKRIGTTEDGQLLIASGAHQIEFVSERFHYRAIASLTIPPGHVLPYTVALPSADVRVITTPGTEVWVEGERVGVAPLDPIHVPIGTREIAVKGPGGAEKRQAVEVKLGESVEVSLTPQSLAADPSPATPHLAPLSR
jgi:PEGA domain-containing protein